MSGESSAELLANYRAGDERAAAALYERYIGRLTRLAASRLSAKIARRTDADDVVQSTFRSFFLRVRDGRLALDEEHDLWRLLVSITLHKLYRQVRHNRAERRSVDAEQTPSTFADADAAFLARDPSPEEAAILADELQSILSRLEPFARRVLELQLQGESLKEIAAETGRSERTMRRALADVRALVLRQAEQADEKGAEPSFAAVPVEALRERRPSDDPAETSALASAVPEVAYADYRLKRLLDAGGVGKVYRAVRRTDGHEVAVKFLRKSFHADPEAIARFRAEAATVATLDHPGIVKVHGTGRTPAGLYFMVLDLVDGADLWQVAAKREIALSEAIDWMAQACDVLEHLHARGVIHCDLKPGNLLLGSAGRVRMTDFGFARSQFAGNRGVAGTAGFMAPEQVSGVWGPISPRTDIYGLGAVLYWLLTGRPPFQGHRVGDVLSQVVSGHEAVPPSDLRAGIPESLNAICTKCLTKRAADRFASAQGLAQSLAVAGVRGPHSSPLGER